MLTQSPIETLSNRELEIFKFIGKGQTTRQIANELHLSIKTVETHRAQVMKRLDIHDLASLVRFAVAVGIVSAAPSR